MHFLAHSFYECLAPPIVVGVLLTCQSLDPEYKMTAFFNMYFQEKNNDYVYMDISNLIIYLILNKTIL